MPPGSPPSLAPIPLVADAREFDYDALTLTPRGWNVPRYAVGLLLIFLAAIRPEVSAAVDIVILKSADLPSYEQAIVGFRSGLPPRTELKEYNLAGDLGRGREIAQRLRAAPPDLVLAVGLKAALAAKLEIVDTPVVFCLVLNPAAQGLPAANMTGIAVRPRPEAQLSALRTVVPNRTRIGVLYDPDQSGAFMREAQESAKKLGVTLVEATVRTSGEIPSAVRTMLPNIDALWLIQDQTVVSEPTIPFFLETTLEARIPLFTFSATLVQQGAIGALIVDAWTVGRQAARLALTRLKDPNTLTGTLHAPDHPQLALNLSTADYLGLAPAPEVMRLAGYLFGGQGPIAKQGVPMDVVP